ncbi:MAG TPA: bifunctional 2-polyprenyl-6-hydroxyphenol methylase/3-demethylubiquinol 3-O-methyltransferase UbiG [Acidobacteriota bacterium]
MKNVTQETYERIDNDLYLAAGDVWRQPDSPFCLMQSSFNPARVGYFKRKLFAELNVDPQGKAALEVGCGGGILCEEIARMGFEVTGIDPAAQALRMAAGHARAVGLRIAYEQGSGEAIPYRDDSFDIVFCCDVLEHVRDVPQVVAEISRVLKPGGVFCYDTLNRTFLSKLVAINIAQVWKRWAFAPPNLHVWEMFIKPKELKSLLGRNNLEWKEHRGLGPNVSALKFLGYLRQRARGALTYKELGERLFAVESGNLGIIYIGYAIKRGG